MSIIRVNKNKDYTVMSNFHLKDKRLSLKAKGLLSVMLSLPKNWDYSIAGLVAISKESESCIKAILDELKKFNYLKIIKLMPDKTESGRIEYIYDIYEKPKQEDKKQEVENQPLEFQPLEIQALENQGQYNTNNKLLNNKLLNNKLLINNTNKNTSNNINSDLENLIDNFSSNIHSITPFELEKIKSWLNVFDCSILNKAIEIATLNNIKTMNYIEGILRIWQSNNFKSLADIENYIDSKNQRKIEKNKKQDEPTEWFNKKLTSEISESESQEMEDLLNSFIS